MNQRPIGKALAYGAISAGLYALLYLFEDQFLQWTTKGRWFFIFPVAAAFVVSFFHGGFTNYFWEVLGIQAKTTKGKR